MSFLSYDGYNFDQARPTKHKASKEVCCSCCKGGSGYIESESQVFQKKSTSKETHLENRIKELETAILSARDSLDSLDSVFAKLVSKALMKVYLKNK